MRLPQYKLKEQKDKPSSLPFPPPNLSLCLSFLFVRFDQVGAIQGLYWLLSVGVALAGGGWEGGTWGALLYFAISPPP